MAGIPGTTRYEKCARCWHFIQPNDADPVPGLPVAAYVHLDNGEREHDHDATPGGDIRTLDQWQHDHPDLFATYPDGETGPNSAHFREACAAGYDAARRSYGDRYADYLIAHDRELAAKGRSPRPWPLSLQGNDGD